MRRALLLASLIFLIAGCTPESTFPNPTGKGSVRAFNAIKGSPDVTFRVEQTLIGAISYKQSSVSRRWDDFEYTFNFEALFSGESSSRRVASTALKVDADQDFTLVLIGRIEAPDVSIWQSPERSFTGTDTVFEARFAHTAESLGGVDVYFNAPGTAPVAGEAAGTLNFGGILAPLDFTAGDYVLTITGEGDPANVVYESDVVDYAAGNAFIIPILDGSGSDVAPFTVRRINAAGGSALFPDARFAPTIRFFQASQDLPPSDVYDDELLENRVLSNHVFGDITGDIEAAAGVTSFTYTAADNAGAIQFEDDISISAGTHNNFVVIGEQGSRRASTFVPDRQSVSNVVKLQVFPASLNHETVDLFVVEADESIDDATRLGFLSYGLPSGSIALEAGSYDVYLTVFDEKAILSGPTRIDVQLGDIVEAIVLDATDPAIAEFRIVPAP